MLDKTFDPAAFERRIYEGWERSGAFAAGARPDAAPFTIMIPPPNVTGSLHIGHALTMTLQDMLIRWRRMQGRDALWQPGTDHAGIATQMVVERLLASQGQNRRAMGREAFLEHVWEWKAQSGGTITRQLRRLGASLDWPRERFTMDEGLSAAVREVFVTLHREGLIYRDRRLVNWDPKLQTAISDLEVESREVRGHLWHLRYPVEGEPGRFLVVATTRPETMLGDTAVAVHPEDARFADLVGKRAGAAAGRAAPSPWWRTATPTRRRAPARSRSRPAHDFNDFEVGRRHGLPMPSVLDAEAQVAVGEIEDELRAVEGVADPDFVRALAGRDREDARKAIVARLEELGLVEKIGAAHPPGAARRPRRRADRAAADGAVVRGRRNAGQAGDRGGGDRPHRFRAEAVGEHLLRLDARHPALVHLPPALVGPPHPRLVRPGRRGRSSLGTRRRREPRRRRITAAPRSR